MWTKFEYLFQRISAKANNPNFRPYIVPIEDRVIAAAEAYDEERMSMAVALGRDKAMTLNQYFTEVHAHDTTISKRNRAGFV